jgi:hypothetical protein
MQPQESDNFTLNTPTITLADNGTQVTSGTVYQSNTNVVLNKWQITAANAAAVLNGLTSTTTGTYATADITNLKVRYSVDATLDAGDATLQYTHCSGNCRNTYLSFFHLTISCRRRYRLYFHHG